MKKNEIALLILIISVSLISSYFITKLIFGEPKSTATKVEVVDPIASTVEQPNPTVFNKDAINPTVVIQIGNPANQPPFNGN